MIGHTKAHNGSLLEYDGTVFNTKLKDASKFIQNNAVILSKKSCHIFRFFKNYELKEKYW